MFLLKKSFFCERSTYFNDPLETRNECETSIQLCVHDSGDIQSFIQYTYQLPLLAFLKLASNTEAHASKY